MLQKSTKLYIFPFLLFLSSFIFAQKVSLEEIWSGCFYPKGIYNIVSMKSGKEYTVLSEEGIDKYSYDGLEKLETLVSGKYTDYMFSPNEQYILLETQNTPIYRRSKKGNYTLYNLKDRSSVNIFNNNSIQEPAFSPDGSKIAFVYENNIYYQEIPSLKIVQVTYDGEKNKIINGVSDWVYEEELGEVKRFEWSPDSKKIAFIRFDESKVKEVSLPIYQKNLYPENLTFKYPKAGEDNSEVSLHIYDLDKNTSTPIPLRKVENYYIVHIKFSPEGHLFTITSNRLQNKIDISSIDSNFGTVRKLFSDTSKTWIDTDNIFFDFLSNGDFVINSERSGYNHLYLYNKTGNLIKALTKGNWEVTEVYGIDEKKQKIYYQSTEKGSENRVIATDNIKKEAHAILTPKNGTNKASFSSDFSFFINNFSTANTPPIYSLRDNNGKVLKVLEDNAELLSFISTKEIRFLEFIQIPNGKEKLNAYIIKPKNIDPNQKYPVLMYVYGGPGSQTVINSWNPFNYWWFQMLAQKGYIIVSVDGHGTPGKGEAFKKAIYKQLGKLALEDQITAAKWLQNQPQIDANRIGIWGWSFGGYLTSLAMTKANDLFKMGIAVAPVTNWRFYDTIYTERFLQTPQKNPSGYDDNSPINFAKNLKGKYLIIHGTADDNVHFQNTTEMINALENEGKQFDMAIYPDKDHGISGGITRYQLYQKMTNYIKENL